VFRTLALMVVAAACVLPALGGEKPDEAKLIAIISSDAPPQDKAIPCKQLAVWGTKAAVPALAALLPNRELSSWARIALEAIPDPACDEALRAAVGKLEGRLLVGVINSIGVRRDAQAIGILVAKLKDPDPEVASAAAEALGRIGGDQPIKVLEPLLASAPPAVRSSVAYGCVLCAERLLDEKKAEEAAKLYDAVRKADVPKYRIAEGTRGAILARGAAGVPLLLEQLRSADKACFWLGLRVARELPGPEATEALVAELGKAAPERQPLLFLALTDRGDPKAMPAILAAAKGGPKALRITAMGALEHIGNASCVPVLLEAALDTDAEIAAAGKVALARLPGKDVDAALTARLREAQGKALALLVELAGQRRIEAALPVLVKNAESADAAVRAAAVAALGSLGGDKQVPDLVKVLQKTQDANDRSAIEKALVAMCGRGGAACTPLVMPLAKSDDSALRVIALHALAVAGGPDALAAVKAALDDKEEGVKDEAVRTLSNWPSKWPDDLAVMDPLLALAKAGKKPAHRILALRGYLQCVQATTKLDAEAKLGKVNEVLPLITRPDETKQAIAALGAIGAPGALERLANFVTDPPVSEEACAAIIALASRGDLKGVSKEQRQKALQAVIDNSRNGRTRQKAQEALKGIK